MVPRRVYLYIIWQMVPRRVYRDSSQRVDYFLCLIERILFCPIVCSYNFQRCLIKCNCLLLLEGVYTSFWQMIPRRVYLYVVLASGTPQSVS